MIVYYTFLKYFAYCTSEANWSIISRNFTVIFLYIAVIFAKFLILWCTFVDVLGDGKYRDSSSIHIVCFRMLNTNRSLLPVCLYLLTFAVGLPLICLLLPLRHSVYYQLFTKLVVLVKPDATSQMDIDLLSELFTKNSERVDVAKSFLERQQSNFVIKNVSTVPVRYQVKDGANLARIMPSWLKSSTVDTKVAVTVSVVIVSAERDSVISSGQKFAPHYLTQNVARFMALLGEQRHSDHVLYQLLVCSVGEHLTAEEQSISRLVQLVRDPQLDSGFTFGPFHDRLAWRLGVFLHMNNPNQFVS